MLGVYPCSPALPGSGVRHLLSARLDFPASVELVGGRSAECSGAWLLGLRGHCVRLAFPRQDYLW